MRRAYYQQVAIAVAAFMLLLPALAVASPIEFATAGPTPASILFVVNAFRSAIPGPNNLSNPGPLATGRREINWDGVPDAKAAPHLLPADFFKVTVPRGLLMNTPGVLPADSQFQVSANLSAVTPPLFGNINPSYPGEFQFFSPERLFTPVGSNQVELKFFVPGASNNTRATVRAFGVVFTDVDLPSFTRVQYYDKDDKLLYTAFVPAVPATAGIPNADKKTLSFLGAGFDVELICRVLITAGTVPLSRTATENPSLPFIDVVAMDDFIYAEPQDAQGACPQ